MTVVVWATIITLLIGILYVLILLLDKFEAFFDDWTRERLSR